MSFLNFRIFIHENTYLYSHDFLPFMRNFYKTAIRTNRSAFSSRATQACSRSGPVSWRVVSPGLVWVSPPSVQYGTGSVWSGSGLGVSPPSVQYGVGSVWCGSGLGVSPPSVQSGTGPVRSAVSSVRPSPLRGAPPRRVREDGHSAEARPCYTGSDRPDI